MGRRRDRLNKRLENAIVTRRQNSQKKNLERQRRDEQMMKIIKNGSFPYTHGVMDWIGQKLNKKVSQLQPEDIKSL